MSTRFASAAQVRAYLDAVPMFGSVGAAAARFGLDAIRSVCAALGNPHLRYRVFHVAGTNGKGTTCHLAAAVWTAAGHRTGLYTSPHLTDVTERFRIDGVPMSDGELLDLMNAHVDLFERHRLTYFEITTALAFRWFADRNCSHAVIETGLGGRLDATNIVEPAVCAITSIGMDHTDVLGPSLTHIAREKAGIIKPSVPCHIGPVPAEAAAVFSEYAEVRYVDGPMELPCDIPGAFTPWNIALVRRALPEADAGLFARAVAVAGARTGFKGRFERLLPDRDWYFDGAHNAEALAALIDHVAARFPARRPLWIVHAMRDKLVPGMRACYDRMDELRYVETDAPRAASAAEFGTYLNRPVPVWNEGESLEKSRLVILTGSFYFYPTVVRRMLLIRGR